MGKNSRIGFGKKVSLHFNPIKKLTNGTLYNGVTEDLETGITKLTYGGTYTENDSLLDVGNLLVTPFVSGVISGSDLAGMVDINLPYDALNGKSLEYIPNNFKTDAFVFNTQLSKYLNNPNEILTNTDTMVGANWVNRELTKTQSGVTFRTYNTIKLTPTTALTAHDTYENQNITTDAIMSIFAKADGYDGLVINADSLNSWVEFDVDKGEYAGHYGTGVLDYGIEDAGDGWFFCWLRINANEVQDSHATAFTVNNRTIHTTGRPVFAGDGVSGILVCYPSVTETVNFINPLNEYSSEIEDVNVISESINAENSVFGYKKQWYQNKFEEKVKLSIPASTPEWKLQQLLMSNAVAISGCNETKPSKIYQKSHYNIDSNATSVSRCVLHDIPDMFYKGKGVQRLVSDIDAGTLISHYAWYFIQDGDVEDNSYIKFTRYIKPSGTYYFSCVLRTKANSIRDAFVYMNGSKTEVISESNKYRIICEPQEDGWYKLTAILFVESGATDPYMIFYLGVPNTTSGTKTYFIGDNIYGMFLSGTKSTICSGLYDTDDYFPNEIHGEKDTYYNYYKQFNAGSYNPDVRMISIDRKTLKYDKARNRIEIQGVVLG